MLCSKSFIRRNAPYFAALLLVLNGLNANATPPTWWGDENYPLIDTAANPANLGIANIGQAKCMAMYALEALRISAPMIAAQVENDLVGTGKPIPSWEPPVTDQERAAQYSPLLLGQLKAIAAPFYTHLHDSAPAWLANERTIDHLPDTGTFFPWTSTTSDDANRAPTAIGQLKSVFALHFETLEAALNPDLDGDGLTNAEEAELGSDPFTVDTDGDGRSDYAENLAGTDPLLADIEELSFIPAPAPNSISDPENSAPAPPVPRITSDGQGLPKKLESGLIGRWDFEELKTITNPPLGTSLFQFADKTSGNRPASTFGVQVANDGMVANAAFHPARNFSTIAPSLLNGRTTYSVSFWAAISPGSISPNIGTGLFTHHRYLPDLGNPQTGRETINVNGVWVQQNANQITLHAGSYIYSTYKMVNGQVVLTPTSKISGISINVAAGQLDDGKFHHYVMVRSGAKTTLYLDGVKIGDASYNSAIINPDNYAGVSVGRFYGLSPMILMAQPANGTGLIGKIDRLRVWKLALKASDVTSIYHQDIDGDGLWDITEARTPLLWRDNNHNGTVDPGENSYQCNPFVWQRQSTDTDSDGLTDIREQGLGTNIVNPDTDGDLIPDGWEVDHDLNPLNPGDGTGNPDNDGLTNLEEYIYNTDPKVADTDHDGKKDGPEVAQGSNPNDGSDGGNPIPADQKVSILLGVGDKSGSESEDYVLNCFRIDPQSGQEQRVYTLRSGGFGKYKEETQSIFKKGESYTFQIDWQSSNMASKAATATTPADGPDYDYTFKVKPQGNPGGVFIDSYDPKTQTTGSTILGDDAHDVAATASEFKENFENRRVALINLKVEWESIYTDASLDNHIDPWTNQQNGKRWFPDSPVPNTADYRDIIGVRVTGGLPNMPVWLQSLDVDDTTSESFDKLAPDGQTLSPVIDVSPDGFDNQTTGSDVAGVSKWGAFQGSEFRTFGGYIGKLEQNGSVLAKLRVGTSPGNNYRVAATVKNREELDSLHTKPGDPNHAMYVSSASSQSPNFAGSISPTLTIWRHLWLEIDTMKSQSTPPVGQENWISGTVSSIAPGTPLSSETPIWGAAATWDCVFTGEINRSLDEFENGWLINGTTKVAYPISGVIQRSSGEIVISSLANPGPLGPFTLLDDDNTDLPPSYIPILPRYSVDYQYISSKFRPAFIEVKSADLKNATKDLPFERNKLVLSSEWNNTKNLLDTKNSWAATAVLAFQSTNEFFINSEDGDPNTESTTAGNTLLFGGCSSIFLEVIRDELDSALRASAVPDVQKLTMFHNSANLTIAHEIGHQPSVLHPIFTSGDHQEGGIMTSGGSSGADLDFTATSIARFRRTLQWSIGIAE